MIRRRIRYTLLAVLLALATLHGCALLEPLQDPDTRVDRLVAEGEYRAALETLDALPDEERAARKDRRETIEARAAEAAENALREAGNQAAEGAVGRALDILEEADARLPASEERQRRIAELERDRRTGLSALERRHRVMEAQALAERLRLLDIMQPLARDDDTLPENIDDLRRRGARLAAELDRDARDAAPETALERLRLARELEPDPERDRRIAELEAELRPDPEPVNQEDSTALLDALERALDEEDLIAARQHCRNIATDRLDDSARDRHDALCERWEEQRDARTAELLEQGSAHYAAGRIREALDTWERALDLDPEHAGLRSARERGRRVLERLDSLRGPADGPETPGEPLRPAP